MSAGTEHSVAANPAMRKALDVALVALGALAWAPHGVSPGAGKARIAFGELTALAARYDRAERENVIRAREDEYAESLARHLEDFS